MGTVTRTVEGSLASFKTCLKRPLQELKVSFGPMQEGSGDPSPENQRNIVGLTGIDVEQCGKNLFNTENAVFGYVKGDGTIAYGWNNRCSDYIRVNPNDQITCSMSFCADGGVGPQIAFFSDKKPESLISRISSNNKAYQRIFSVPINTKYIRVWFSAGGYSDIPSEAWFDENVHCQIEIWHNATDYEPYSGSTNSISWQNEAGEVYGGYIDLVGGELVATHKKATFDGSSDFTVQSSSLYVIWKDIPDMAVGSFYGDSYSLCDKCVKVSARSMPYPGHLEILIGYNNRSIYMYYLNEYAGTTGDRATVRAWLNENPITVTYPLATPIHYQLTPQQIKTLIGRNNIWSPQGSVSVKYLDKDTKDLLWAKRKAAMAVTPKIGGLPILYDNKRLLSGNALINDRVQANNSWFVSGWFDTGTNESKSYTVKFVPFPDDSAGNSYLKLYNDKTGTSVDNWSISANGYTRTFTSGGRYVACSIHKLKAPSFFIYDNTNQRYVCKGDNVIDVEWNQGCPTMTSGNWEPYPDNPMAINLTFDGDTGIATWLRAARGYGATVRPIVVDPFSCTVGDILYGSYEIYPDRAAQWAAEMGGGMNDVIPVNAEANTWTRIPMRITATRTSSVTRPLFLNLRTSNVSETGMVVKIRNPIYINLTQMYGAGNEPTLEEFERQCAINGIDLTQYQPQDNGTVRPWILNPTVVQSSFQLTATSNSFTTVSATSYVPGDTITVTVKSVDTSQSVTRYLNGYFTLQTPNLTFGNNYIFEADAEVIEDKLSSNLVGISSVGVGVTEATTNITNGKIRIPFTFIQKSGSTDKYLEFHCGGKSMRLRNIRILE